MRFQGRKKLNTFAPTSKAYLGLEEQLYTLGSLPAPNSALGLGLSWFDAKRVMASDSALQKTNLDLS